MIKRRPFAPRWLGEYVVGLALLGALGCGTNESGVGAYQRDVQAKENAVSALEGLGKLEQKPYREMPSEKGWIVNLSGKQLNDATFRELGKIGHIMELNLSKTNLSDADMKQVNGLANFCKILDLSQTEITDAGLGEMKNQTILKELNLAGTKCTQAAVDAYKQRLLEQPKFKPRPTVKLK